MSELGEQESKAMEDDDTEEDDEEYEQHVRFFKIVS
jgi:hypothetical protein